MDFNQFAEKITDIYSKDSATQIELLAELFLNIPYEQLRSAIYLCQGRLGPATTHLYRPKGWPSQSEIIEGLVSNPDPISATTSPTIEQVYRDLQNCITFDDIPSCRKDYLHKIRVLKVDKKSIEILALIFSKSLFTDELIIKALTQIGKGGVDAESAIKKLYQTTIPDLGYIAISILKQGYYSTVILPPQFGIIVPREEIDTWESIEEVWRILKATEGLFIQGKFFDGLHIQIHKKNDQVRIFNIRGNEITSSYFHLVNLINNKINETEVIIDCEMIGLDPKSRLVLPLNKVPNTNNHILAVFDILKMNDEDWRKKTYKVRKNKLEELFGRIKMQEAGIYLPKEKLAMSLIDAKIIVNEFFEQPQFEGVVIKTPYGLANTGSVSHDRGRLKPYTYLDSILVGYNTKERSYLVGLWENSEKGLIIPYRNVEGVKKNIAGDLLAIVKKYGTKERPEWVYPHPEPDTYIAKPFVVAVKCDGLIVPNRGKRFLGTKWLLHEGAAIEGLYPSGEKEANTLDRIYNLRKRNQN